MAELCQLPDSLLYKGILERNEPHHCTLQLATFTDALRDTDSAIPEQVTI